MLDLVIYSFAAKLDEIGINNVLVQKNVDFSQQKMLKNENLCNKLWFILYTLNV